MHTDETHLNRSRGISLAQETERTAAVLVTLDNLVGDEAFFHGQRRGAEGCEAQTRDDGGEQNEATHGRDSFTGYGIVQCAVKNTEAGIWNPEKHEAEAVRKKVNRADDRSFCLGWLG